MIPTTITPTIALIWLFYLFLAGFGWTAGAWLWGRLVTGFRRQP